MKKLVSLLLALLMVLTSVSALAEADLSENVTLKILCRSNVQTIEASEMSMFNEAAKAVNVTLEWTQIRSGWDEKKAVLLASGDYPDIFLTGLTTADVTANLPMFADMTDLIPEYAPNVARMFEESYDAKVAATYNDRIYSLPWSMGFRPRSYCTLGINQQWLDKLGLAVPTTMDELEAVLIAFRDGDPNGNGIKDEIPFDYPSPGSMHDAYVLTGAFGVAETQGTYRTVVKDGKVSYLYETDAYKKVTEYLHRWYKEGLITPEVFTNDYAASNALCGQGEIARVGFVTGYSPENRCGVFGDQYIVLPQLSGGEGYTKEYPRAVSGRVISANGVVMSESCENKERAMMFINELYSDDFAVQAYFGSFDTGLVTKYEDGTYSINMPKDYASIEESKWVYALVDYTCGFFSSRLDSLVTAPEELTKRIDQDEINVPYWVPETDVYPSLAKFTEEELEEMTYIGNDVLQYVNQKTAEWVVNGGVEEEWDAFQQQLKDLGLDTLRSIHQRAYNDYYGI